MWRRFSNLFCLLLAVLMGGCGTLGSGKTAPLGREVPQVERSFAAALHYLRTGNEAAAREQFERVAEGSSLAGITDEALFRLAILKLREEGGQGDVAARKLLERLSREFPDSSWSRQSGPLLGYIREIGPLRSCSREIRNLRNQNLSLSRDNKDLRQSIERIKNLDLELEQKIRR